MSVPAHTQEWLFYYWELKQISFSTHVCICVCIYVCMYACMYVCKHDVYGTVSARSSWIPNALDGLWACQQMALLYSTQPIVCLQRVALSLYKLGRGKGRKWWAWAVGASRREAAAEDPAEWMWWYMIPFWIAVSSIDMCVFSFIYI